MGQFKAPTSSHRYAEITVTLPPIRAPQCETNHSPTGKLWHCFEITNNLCWDPKVVLLKRHPTLSRLSDTSDKLRIMGNLMGQHTKPSFQCLSTMLKYPGRPILAPQAALQSAPLRSNEHIKCITAQLTSIKLLLSII